MNSLMEVKAIAREGKKHTPEAKAKMSEARKGKKHSPETKAKMSRSRKGNTNRLGSKHSPEALAKMSKKATGRKHTPEAKAKIAKAKMGNTNAAGHLPSQETLAKLSRAVSKSNRERGTTPETRAKRSLNAAKLMAQGRFKLKFGKRPRYTTQDGNTIIFRSSWEYKVAVLMDQLRWNWIYEERPITHNGESYLPDFFVYDAEGKLTKIIEVKGWFRPGAREKLVRFEGYLNCLGVYLEIWDQKKLRQLGIL